MSIPLGDAIVRILADATQLNKGLNQAMGRVQKLGQNMSHVGTTMTMGLTLPIIGVGIAAVKTATDFDAAMRNMNAIAQMNEEQFQSMKEEVLDFSTTTRASSTDVANALTAVVAAGYEADDAFEILKASSRAAGAGLASIDDTSRALTATLASYNMTAEDSSMIMDKFLQIVNLGRLDLPDLAASIGTVLPIASSLGITLDEAGAALATLTNAGLSTAEASTYLRATFTSLMKPSADLTALVQEHGYESAAALLKTEGLAGALEFLQDATGGEADKLAQLLPNIRAIQGATILLKEDSEGYLTALEKMSDAEGAVERAREEQYKSLSAQLARLKSAFEVILITLGEEFIPIITDLVKALVPLVRGFRNIPKPMLKIGIAVAGVVAAIGPLLLIMGKVVTLSATLGPVFAGIAGTLGTILVPIGLLVGAAALLYKAWTDNWFGIQEIVKETIGRIVDTVRSLITFLQDLARYFLFVVQEGDALNDWLMNLPEAIRPLIQTIGEFIINIREAVGRLRDALMPILSAIVQGFMGFVGHVRDTLSKFWTEIQPKLLAAWERIFPVIKRVLDAVVGIVNRIADFFREHRDTIIGIIRGLWTVVKGIFDTAFSIIGGLIKVFLDIIAGDWEAVREDLIGIAEGIKAGLKTVWEGIKRSLGVIVAALIRALKAKFLELGDKITAAIISKISDIVDAMRRMKQRIVDEVRTWPGKFLQFGKDLVQGFIDGITSGFQNLLDALRRLRALLPFSLAKEGPFSVPVKWDYVTKGLPEVLGEAQLGVAGLASPAGQVREAAPSPIPAGGVTVVIEGDIYGIDDFQRAVKDVLQGIVEESYGFATGGAG